LYDTQTGRRRVRVTAAATYLAGAQVAVAADGRYVAASHGASQKFQLWRADGKGQPLFSGELVDFFPEHLAFSADGRLVAATSADGKYLASGGADTTAVVWDLPELLKRVPRLPVPAQPTAEQIDLWWAYLGSNDPARAGEALWMFGHLPAEALALFKQRLR